MTELTALADRLERYIDEVRPSDRLYDKGLDLLYDLRQHAAGGWELLQWLDDRVREGRGAIELGLTENGDVGLWIRGEPIASGDTVEEAISKALEREGEETR